jgi:hypothetical protein
MAKHMIAPYEREYARILRRAEPVGRADLNVWLFPRERCDDRGGALRHEGPQRPRNRRALPRRPENPGECRPRAKRARAPCFWVYA